MPYTGQLILKYFPEGLQLLQEELATGFHPELEKKLSSHPIDEWEIRLAEIATHCDVLLNGDYTQEDLNKLASVLSGRLQVLRDKNAVRGKVEIILPLEPPKSD